MSMNVKYELRAWVSCEIPSKLTVLPQHFSSQIFSIFINLYQLRHCNRDTGDYEVINKPKNSTLPIAPL